MPSLTVQDADEAARKVAATRIDLTEVVREPIDLIFTSVLARSAALYPPA